MLKIIDNIDQCLKYDENFFGNLIKNHNGQTKAYIKYEEISGQPLILTKIYYNSDNNCWPPKKTSLWFCKRFLSKTKFKYFIGICEDDDFYKTPENQTLVIHERVSLYLDIEDYKSSQIVFSETGNVLIKSDLSFFEGNLNLLEENYNLIKVDELNNQYLIDLGNVKSYDVINNLNELLLNMKFENSVSPFIKIISVKTPIFSDNPPKNTSFSNFQDKKDGSKINKKTILLNALKQGKTVEEACKEADIYTFMLKVWILKGKNGYEEYAEFYKEYADIINNSSSKIDQKPCPSCGFLNNINHKYCVNCGNSLVLPIKYENTAENPIKDENHDTKNILYNDIKEIEENEISTKKYSETTKDILIDVPDKTEVKELSSNDDIIEINGADMIDNDIFNIDKIKDTINHLDVFELDLILDIQELPHDEKESIEDKKLRIIDNVSDKDIITSFEILENIYDIRRKILKLLIKSPKSQLIKLITEDKLTSYEDENKVVIINQIMNNLKINQLTDLLENLNDGIYVLEDVENDTSIKNEKFCQTCGKILPKEYDGDECNTCLRKSYVSKIIKELLSAFGVGKSFNKEDLIGLGHDSYKAMDYIFILKDFELLNDEGNGNYSLKNEEILEEHIIDETNEINIIKEYFIANKSKEDDSDKLSKTCVVCNKNLPISNFYRSLDTEDGYEEFCKSCKKTIQAALCLNNILNYVKPGKWFKVSDILENYPSKTILLDDIWRLEDFDLIIKDENKYCLIDEDAVKSFLDENLYNETSFYDVKHPVHTDISDEIIDNDGFINFTKFKILNRKMNLFLTALEEGYDTSTALEKADVGRQYLNSWILHGKNGNPNFIKFYEVYLKVKPEENDDKVEKTSISAEIDNETKNNDDFINFSKNETKNRKMNLFLNALIECSDTSTALKIAELERSDLNSWIILGENKHPNYIKFYEAYLKVKPEENDEKPMEKNQEIPEPNLMVTKEDYEILGKSLYDFIFNDGEYIFTYYNPDRIRNDQMNLFIKTFRETKDRVTAYERAGTSNSHIWAWCKHGRAGKQNYLKFYRAYRAIKDKIINKDISVEKSDIATEKTIVEKNINHNSKADKDLILINSQTTKTKIQKFFKALKSGNNKYEACISSGLNVSYVNRWYTKGKNGQEGFIEFYENYKKAKNK